LTLPDARRAGNETARATAATAQRGRSTG
jgi:hypothetical protein